MNPSAGVAVWQKPARPASGRFLKVAARGLGRRGARELPRRVLFPVVDARGSASGDSAHDKPVRLLLRGSCPDPTPPRGFFGVRGGVRLLELRRCACCRAAARCMAMHVLPRGPRSPRAGLLGRDGIILGRRGRRCLMLAGQQGVALAAPPRAGKGTGVVVPNALNWPGSLVCVDIKRENWTITAGFRAPLGPGVLSL